MEFHVFHSLFSVAEPDNPSLNRQFPVSHQVFRNAFGNHFSFVYCGRRVLHDLFLNPLTMFAGVQLFGKPVEHFISGGGTSLFDGHNSIQRIFHLRFPRIDPTNRYFEINRSRSPINRVILQILLTSGCFRKNSTVSSLSLIGPISFRGSAIQRFSRRSMGVMVLSITCISTFRCEADWLRFRIIKRSTRHVVSLNPAHPVICFIW